MDFALLFLCSPLFLATQKDRLNQVRLFVGCIEIITADT